MLPIEPYIYAMGVVTLVSTCGIYAFLSGRAIGQRLALALIARIRR